MISCQDLPVLVLIPVRNEAETIAAVIQALQSYGLTQIRVVDNGSTDGSGAIAEQAGAEVVTEPIPGYGQSCWRGLQHLPAQVEWILFCDGDGSDDLSQLPLFLATAAEYDLILGNRRATAAGRAVLTPAQNFGSQLAGFLIQLGWGQSYRDLGPLRLIRRSALEQFEMQDRGFGWTVEMQVRAVEAGLRICELPVGYRPRQGGRSKISGTLVGSLQAGLVILSTLAVLYAQKLRRLCCTRSLGLGLSSLLLLAGCLWLMPAGNFQQTEMMPQFWLGVSLLGLGFACSWGVRAISASWFWAVVLISRLLLLPMYPGDDVWRYLWEGYLQTLGFSPYELAPNAPELAAYRTDWWPLINHPDVTSIYPPVAQLGFWMLASITPSVLVFKLAFVGVDLLICWLLSRRFGYAATLLYAWNPLVIYSFAGAAHYDSWFLLPIVVAWLMFDSAIQPQSSQPQSSQRSWSMTPLMSKLTSAGWIGLSIAIKWMSLPLLGFVIWQTLKQTLRQPVLKYPRFRYAQIKSVGWVMLCGSLPLLLAAVPFCQGGACTLVPTGSVFVSHGRSAELIPYGVSLIWQPARWENWLYAIPLGLVIGWLLLRTKYFLVFTEWYFFALLILSPIVHAWYFTWLIPFGVASRNWGTRLVSLSAFIYFVLPHRQALGNRDWLLLPLERGILWAPLLLGWLWMVIQPMLRSSSGTIQEVEPQ
ncbi:glycosyltransferase family 2 protein [Leptolyngbya sp. NK1-12]|uniref:Glycosyltransferase family 2 protein n=1 Tax=Leptolyngbya sp. NK1-12 TaxID=2547451 RepID=A0AA96WVA5_9CYAN|nr:glycosyltransferase family 2 protein [Leptolyngbya sp. NK1-12]WNZ24192.1 glycosyltransferase family 2 protein [Leptolyngbya sp. NK1-12]